MNRIEIEEIAETDCHVSHSRERLIADESEPGQSALAANLRIIPGVTSVSIRPYAVDIFKARLYDWPEIDPVVIRRLS